MTTTLAIPKKIATHQPKPTKAQLVEALLVRAEAAHERLEEARRIKREAIEAQVREEADKLLAAAKLNDFDFTMNRWHKRCSFDLQIESPKITKLIEAADKFHYCRFDRDATKKKIAEQLKTPNPLLGDDDTAKALDQLLERIMNVNPAIEA